MYLFKNNVKNGNNISTQVEWARQLWWIAQQAHALSLHIREEAKRVTEMNELGHLAKGIFQLATLTNSVMHCIL